MANSQSRTPETMTKTPQRIQVDLGTAAGLQIPAAHEGEIVWTAAISKNTIECTSAMTARFRLVRMENSPI